jgi:hypothetical protein
MRKMGEKIQLLFLPVKENNYRPKFLESKLLFYYIVILILLKLIALPFLFYFPKSFLFADIAKNVLVKLINTNRASFGLPPLKENIALDKAAYLKAEDMLQKGYFSHQSPQGVSPWHWLKSAGYNYQLAGENLAVGFLDSEEVTQAWMNSPSHKKNILNPNYQEIGTAVVRGNFQGNETNLVVQFFGTAKKQKAPLVGTKKIKEALTAVDKKTSEDLNKEIEENKKEALPKELKSLRKKIPPAERILSVEAGQKKREGFARKLFSFLSFNYYRWLQNIIYGFLILIIISLLINVFIKFDIQHWDLIAKALGMIALLIIFLLIDKTALIQLIPHTLKVY